MKKIKLLTMTTAAAILAISTSITAFATGWQKNGTGWWFGTNADNTTWHAGSWQWIDGNNDGVAECYYFDANGYMLSSTTTPDGYTVNADGAWTENGVVQTKQVASGTTASAGTDTSAASSSDEAIEIRDILNLASAEQSIVNKLVKDNGGYDSQGMSKSALYMINHTRNDNKKFGEILVDNSSGANLRVYYKNGFMMWYPKNSAGQRSVYVAPVFSSQIDTSYLCKYVDGSDRSTLINRLLNAGFNSSDLHKWGDVTLEIILAEGNVFSTGNGYGELLLPTLKKSTDIEPYASDWR